MHHRFRLIDIFVGNTEDRYIVHSPLRVEKAMKQDC